MQVVLTVLEGSLSDELKPHATPFTIFSHDQTTQSEPLIWCYLGWHQEEEILEGHLTLFQISHGGVIIKSAVYKILKVLAHRGMVAICLTSLNLMLSFIIVLMSDDV